MRFKAQNCVSELQSTIATPEISVSITNLTRESRISPIDMKLICDAHYGTLPQPQEYANHLREHSVNSAKYYDRRDMVVFVDSTAVDDFLQNHASRFAHPFVLVSGDSDTSMPVSMEVAKLASDMIRRGRILHWYAMNCQISIMPHHYTCIPNGISQWDQQREAMQIAFETGYGLLYGIRQRPGQQKKELPMAIMAFGVHSNVGERQPLWDLGCGAIASPNLRGLVECFYNGTGVLDKQVEFYRYISTIKFVFSPHGAGLDCYRTYEALYLGSYPIVKTSSLDVLYENLPVLIVQEWSDVNKQLLEATYERFQQTKFDFTPLYRAYWSQRFRSHFARET